MAQTKRILLGLLVVVAIAAGCSDTATTTDEVSVAAAPVTNAAPAEAPQATGADDGGGGIRLVSAGDGAAIQADPPQDLVILDVRTPEEFAEGHLEGATMIDFYRPDFASQLAELDPAVPYLLYCRSGNRSGQTAAIMAGLGFTDVADIDGGILAWSEAGLPTVGQ